jgi:hypothetical protein
MKQGLLIFILLSITVLLKAQKNYEDIVFLKNGDIVKGVIIEQTLNKSIKLVSFRGDTVYYSLDEIQKLTRELTPGEKIQSDTSKWSGKGYQLIIETGFGFSVDKFGTNFGKFNIINGLRFSRYFFTGFGIGLRYNPKTKVQNISPDYTHLMFNVFSDFRFYLPLIKKTSTYLRLELGYTFEPDQVWGLDKNYHSVLKSDYSHIKGRGLSLNPSAGMVFRLSDKTNLHLGISYDMQAGEFWVPYKLGSQDVFLSKEKMAGSICINGGIIF